MNVSVNGEQKEVDESTTVSDLLHALGLGGALVAVERNREIVPRAEHGSTRLCGGDAIEIVHFVGGG